MDMKGPKRWHIATLLLVVCMFLVGLNFSREARIAPEQYSSADQKQQSQNESQQGSALRLSHSRFPAVNPYSAQVSTHSSASADIPGNANSGNADDASESSKSVSGTSTVVNPNLSTEAAPITAVTALTQEPVNVFNEILLSGGCNVGASVRGNLGPASVVVSEVMDDWLKDRWQAAMNMGGEPIRGPHWLVIELKRPAVVTRVVIDWESAFSTNWVLLGNANPTTCNPKSTPTSRLEFLRSQQLLKSDQPTNPFSAVDECMNVGSGWETLIDSRKDKVMQRKTDKHVVQVTTVDKKVKNISPAGGLRKSHDNSSEYIVNLADGYQMVGKGPYKLIKLLIRSHATNWGSSIWRLQIWGSEISS